MNNRRWQSALLSAAGALALFATSACSSEEAIEKSYSAAKAACEQKPAAQRDACLNAATQQYQSDIKQHYVSSCPKSTC